MKNYILIILLLLTQSSSAQTVISGTIFSDTTISVAQSPYHVTGNLFIPNGVKVIIEPGVVLEFDVNIRLGVEGELRAKGTPSDPIIFKRYPSSSSNLLWGGIEFNSSAVAYNESADSGCIFDYCKISGAKGSIRINETSVWFLNSEMSDCDGGIMAYGSDIRIQNSKIHDCHHFAITTFYGIVFPKPVIIDNCDIYNIAGTSDAVRLTANAQLINSNIYNCTNTAGALSVWAGPSIVVGCNNFYNNDNIAISIINSPDSSVKITDNNLTNNKINMATSACYKTPIILRNNFNSYKDYHIYCAESLDVLNVGVDCHPVPNNSSYFTLNLKQNYFAYTSTNQLDSAIYDFYDDWEGRTIISYDTNINNPYDNSTTCLIEDTTTNIISVPSTKDIITVFPNPASDQLNIHLSNKLNNKILLRLYNAVGSCVYQQSYPNHQSVIQLDISEFHPGLYFISIEDGSVKTTKKVSIL